MTKIPGLRDRLADGPLVVASHNPGKVREIGELLAPLGLSAVSAGELALAEPQETGDTYEANAALKALAAARASGRAALADDSGLSVDALDGQPGIHSARWAGPERDFMLAMRRVEEALRARGARNPEARRARFVSVLCLAFPDGETHLFRGEVTGTLVWPPRGEKGFGYDPMFLPDGHALTFGEMAAAQKHGIAWSGGHGRGLSHRARAFAAFAAAACLAPSS